MQLNDTKIQQLLGQAGLTLNEANIYIFLLKHGLSPGADIYLQLGMDKSSCYRSINSLIDRNLIFKIGEERNQKFGANPAEHISAVFDKQIKDIHSAKQSFEKILVSLEDLTRNEYYRNNITILRGKAGFKEWNISRLKTGVKLIREISSRLQLEPLFENAQEYDDYMDYYIAKRKGSGIRMNLLINPETKDDYIDVTSGKDLRETRILPSQFNLDAVLSTWGEYTGFISQKSGDVLLIIIKDNLITNVVAQMFDVIWNISTLKKEAVMHKQRSAK